MWRLSSLFNFFRGGVRSGVWRVREPHSQLFSEERERDDRPPESSPVQLLHRLPRHPPKHGPLLVQLRTVHTAPKCAQPVDGDLLPTALHLPSLASLWYLGLAAGPDRGDRSDAQTPRERTEISAPSTGASGAGDTPGDTSAVAAAGDNAADLGAELDPADPLSSLRAAFATKQDRLMAELQNTAGAGVATSRPRQALQCFRAAAALGSPPAWFNAGVCFQQGIGTAVDLHKAALCYREAVRLGHGAAAYNLALLLAAGDAPTSAGDAPTSAGDAPTAAGEVTRLLERAAAAGCAQAAPLLHAWRQWEAEMEEEEEEEMAPLSPPPRSVSLPALQAGRSGCGTGHGGSTASLRSCHGDLGSCGDGLDDWDRPEDSWGSHSPALFFVGTSREVN